MLLVVVILLSQANGSHSSTSSMELFADVSHKARQRQRHNPPTVSAVAVADENRKKNCRRPRNVRKNCQPQQQQQTRKLPSFSEFDSYSLCIESKGNIAGDDGSLNVDKEQIQEDCNGRLCSIEMLSLDGPCEPGCQQRNKRRTAGSVSSQLSSVSRAGLLTSTPHPQSAVKMSAYSELIDGTSQLQLFDASVDAEIGMCRCLVAAQYQKYT